MVLAGVVATDEVDVAGERLIQDGVIQNEDAGGKIDLGPGFRPECHGVRLKAMQKAGESVVGGRAGFGWLDASRLDRAGRLRRGDQEVDVVLGTHARRVHAPQLTISRPLAQAQLRQLRNI